MFKRWFNSWCRLDGIVRFLILAIVFAVLFGAVLAIIEDWSLWKENEERYLALEAVANDIVENKNFSQPLTDTLKSYDVTVNEKKIEITLFSNGIESVELVLHDDYQIQEMRRISRFFEYVLMFLFAIIAIGLMISTIAYAIYYMIKKIVRFVKNETKNDVKV